MPSSPRSVARLAVASSALLLLLLCSGCATRCLQDYPRRFAFETDTFAYRNDLVWEYVFDDQRHTVSTRPRNPKPDYTHHCFVVARSARQFFQHARFDPHLPRVGDERYRKLIQDVVGRDPSHCTLAEDRIVIPGFMNLREFSTAKEQLLKDECGGAWHSYFQRGHWRMVAPFSRNHQEREAQRLMQAIRIGRPAVVHIVKFPQLTINHALVLYDVIEGPEQIRFSTYDPYEPNRPETLTFDRETRTFSFPRNGYFLGGEVDIYEIYKRWNK